MRQNIVFDLDGTLVDSLPGIEFSARQALASLGYAWPARQLRSLIGPPIRAILSSLSGEQEPARLEALEQSFRRSYDASGWQKSALYPGVEDSLDRLREQGARLWIATNKPQRVTRQILERAGLIDRFAEILCRDSIEPPFASKAKMLEWLLQRGGMDRADCVLVGDTPEDCEAANQAGISVIIVEHGYGDFSEFRGQTPFLRIKNIAELVSVYA